MRKHFKRVSKDILKRIKEDALSKCTDRNPISVEEKQKLNKKKRLY